MQMGYVERKEEDGGSPCSEAGKRRALIGGSQGKKGKRQSALHHRWGTLGCRNLHGFFRELFFACTAVVYS